MTDAEFLAAVCQRVEALQVQRQFAEPKDLGFIAADHLRRMQIAPAPLTARQHGIEVCAHVVIAMAQPETTGELLQGDMS